MRINNYFKRKSLKYWMFFSLVLLFFLLLQPSTHATETVDEEEIPVPILMYHSILNHPPARSEFVLSTEIFQSDMDYLKAHGYTTVFIADLIAYVREDAPLPEKPVVITLDDGYLNNLAYVLPILEATEAKATISVVGSFTARFSENPDPNLNYGHLTWADIKTLHRSNRVEIGNHSYSLHRDQRMGAMKMRNESAEAYRKRLMEDIGRLQENLEEKTGVLPTVFAYPFGLISREALPVLKELGFQAVLNCFEEINHISKDPECLFHLNRFNRPGGVSTEAFMKKFDIR